MESKRTAYHHGDLRNALLDAATQSIENGDIASLSVRALAQQSGVFHRAAYRHFKDKDELLCATLARAYGRLASRFARQVKSPEPRRKLVQIALAYADFCFDEPRMFLAMSGPRVNPAVASEELEAALQLAFAPTLDAIEAGRAANIFKSRHSAAAAVFFWGALQGLLTQIVHGRIKVPAGKRAEFVEDAALRLIAGLEFATASGKASIAAISDSTK